MRIASTTTTSKDRRAVLAMLLLGLAATTGCQDKHPGIVPVSGVVTIDGQPVVAGQVTVSAAGHRPAMARIAGDGSFTLTCFEPGDGAPLGTHPVTVTAVEPIDEHSNRWHAPKKYANKVSSGLSVTIDGPTDDLKIELTWAGSKHSGPFIDRF